ncbi:MAG: hypothetical protein HQL19_00370 [Candidatus Omnitrophica bacterium]|nr:hypothetical protein [Candidatus Omnitrophota bacterium]
MRRSLFLFSAIVLVSGCASLSPMPALQPDVNKLLVTGHVDEAVQKISAESADYGPGNYLLYYLDRGMIEHYAGKYADSEKSFEKAKQRFTELYTKSITAEAESWLINDHTIPYCGSDYEYVLINVIQALNYVAQGNIAEALVEARDLDAKYQVIDSAARNAKRAYFADNGFARFLMGILYEAEGTPADLQDALLSYKEALALYEGYYAGAYTPQMLKENYMALADYLGNAMPGEEQKAVAGVHPEPLRERRKKSEVILIELTGVAPVKVGEMVPLPIDGEFIVKMEFPKFVRRAAMNPASRFVAEQNGIPRASKDSELGADIEDIAVRDLDARRVSVLGKSVVRPALKYLILRKQKENIEKHYGKLAADLFGVVGNLYNVYSEQADLRSWQALPGQIRVSRLVLDPGAYHLRLNSTAAPSKDLGDVNLNAGEIRFVITRTALR